MKGVIQALKKAPSVESREYAWTVLDVMEAELKYKRREYRYIAGSLVKYNPSAAVEVVDEAARKTRLQEEPNLQLGASTFVYFPDEAIFGHKRIWNIVSPKDFRSQIAAIVEAYYDNFFVECELEPVVDLKRFLDKLAQFETVNEIRAKISPPNPLFGPFWKKLKEYLEERRAQSLSLSEKASKGESLKTMVLQAVQSVDENEVAKTEPAPLADAAILMAADGYGHATVTGRQGKNLVVVRTSEKALHLKLPADLHSDELAKAVISEIVKLNHERRLQH